MQSDRELLEAAARAAGIPAFWDELSSAVRVVEDNGRWYLWRPLTDDGDALRLACALKINIEHAETLKRKAHGVNCWPVGRGDCGQLETDLTDYAGATRRSIVRAAAALAPTTPPKEPT